MLTSAYNAWTAASQLRARRLRQKRYTYGQQWLDPVTDINGRVMTEQELFARQGRSPLTNNMIRQLVKCVIGNYRSSIADNDPAAKIPVDPETATRNSLLEMDCRMLEEFLISGCAIQRVTVENRVAGRGVWVDNVSPDDFFVNRFTDPRGLDIELVGMLHSWSLREVLMRFGRSEKMRRLIRQAYSPAMMPGPALASTLSADFFTAPDGRCRVVEVWSLEQRNLTKCVDLASGKPFEIPSSESHLIKDENRRRRADGRQPLRSAATATLRWHCRFYAPNGLLLDEFDSPYAHGLHPFAVKFFPLTDGEVHSFVEDIIDQQRTVNRMITLIDHIVGVSAKGILLFPADQKPDGITWAEVGKIWAQPDAVLPYDPQGSTVSPRQIVATGNDAGASNLLSMELQLLQQISGVSDAMQGKISTSNQSAALFDSQLRSSAIALLDLLDSFNSFRLARNGLIARS